MAQNAIGWRAPQVTPEISALIRSVREDRQRLQSALEHLDEQQTDAFVQSQIIGADGAAFTPPLDLDRQTDELCEHCLTAKGPFDRGRNRIKLREQARIHLHLSRGPFALHSSEDLLQLWDEATYHELLIREFVHEPRWRTEADGVPFTGAKMAAIFGLRSLTPGDEMASPADIPHLVDEIVAFATREDLPPELIAFGMSYLIFRIHPFKDGNGHTLRMLTCSIMHAAEYPEPTLLVYIDLLREHTAELCDLSREVSLGRAHTEDHVIFLLTSCEMPRSPCSTRWQSLEHKVL